MQSEVKVPGLSKKPSNPLERQAAQEAIQGTALTDTRLTRCSITQQYFVDHRGPSGTAQQYMAAQLRMPAPRHNHVSSMLFCQKALVRRLPLGPQFGTTYDCGDLK